MGYQRRKGPIDYKGYGRKKKQSRKRRISNTGILLIFMVGALFFWLVTPGEDIKEEGTAVQGIDSFQERKNIYDRSLEALAVSFDLYAAYIKPLEVEDSRQTGEKLAAILELDRDQLIKRLRTERSFIWLSHQVPREKVAELSKLDITGLYFQKAPVRFYPQKKTAAQVLGYVKDEQGLAGIELFYDKELMGRALAGVGGGPGKQIFAEGKHIVLTLDLKTQTILEKQMALLLDKTQASSVAAMAVDPATGEILASVQLPSFDPNSFWDATPQSQKMEMVSRVMNTGGISGLFRYGAAVHADRDIQVPEMNFSSGPVIRPRLQKSGGRARAGYWWPWPGGGFISDELAELPDPTISAEELLAFQQDLGVSCADLLDVPDKADVAADGGECGEGRLNGVSVLGAFSRLVNGGKPVALHFLKGSVDMAGNFSAYEFEAQGRDVAKVSAVLKTSFAASAGDKAQFFAAEYLSPLAPDEDFIVESQDGEQASKVLKRVQTYNGLFVAASPITKPRIVLLISVQDGDFDLQAASPMRRFGDAFMRLSAQERTTSVGTDLATNALPSDDPLLAAWLEQRQEKSAEQEAKKSQMGKMPNVVGLSLRKALLELTPCKVEIDIAGAGRVVGQDPGPGQSCGDRIHLKLASGAGEQPQQ